MTTLPHAPDAAALLRAELRVLHPSCFGWALTCTRHDPDAASDVLQMSYERILEGRARFEGRSSFRTWVFGLIRLVALEHKRRRLWRLVLGWTGAAEPSSEESPQEPYPRPDSDLARNEEADVIRAAVLTLPSRQREVLHLVFYEDFTLAQAAEAMGVSIGSARQHYERGKTRLRALLMTETK